MLEAQSAANAALMPADLDDASEQHVRLQASASVNAQGEFEIIAINAGTANGWEFPADVLRASLALWDRVDCFVDHSWWSRSARDLGGVCYAPSWNAAKQGVQLKLKPLGPSGELVATLGRNMLGPEPKPNIGFSADILFTANGRRVQTILQIFSLDLVYNPARGGEFLRALNSWNAFPNAFPSQRKPLPDSVSSHVTLSGDGEEAKGGTMPETTFDVRNAAVGIPEDADLTAMRQLLGVQREKTALAAEAQAALQVRTQMCGYLLDSGLAASKLPAPMQAHVRKQFQNDDGTTRIFEPQQLTIAIEDARKLVSDLTGPGAVAGPRSQISLMFNSDDQITAAVEDLFEVQRSDHLKNVKPHKLGGVRELYLGLTGDVDFYGGYDHTRALFQHTTASFPGLVKNAMNKLMLERWNQLGRAGYDWWEKIVHVEHFTDLKQITWLIFGTIASLPTVAQGAEYTELKIGDSPETSDFTKYGGYVGITLETIINDDTRKLRAIPRELASAAIRNISSLVAAIFTDASGVGPTLADGGALFNSTAVTTAGGHANLLTTALGTDYTAWNAAASAVYNQPLLVANETGYTGTGKKMALDPKFCLVPRALKAQAEALFLPRWASTVEGIASAGGPTFGGHVVPITVPEWTDATDWAAVVDPMLAPSICIGEAFGIRPEIFIAGDQQSPAMFSNDESRIKVRHWLAVGVADFRPLHKSNVAG